MCIGNFGHFKMAVIEFNRVLEGVPESRVAGLVLVLVFEREQTLGADPAVVHTDIVVPPVLVREGSLGPVLLCHPVNVRTQHCLQMLAATVKTIVHPSCKLFELAPLLWLAVFRLVNVMYDTLCAVGVLKNGEVIKLVVNAADLGFCGFASLRLLQKLLAFQLPLAGLFRWCHAPNLR